MDTNSTHPDGRCVVEANGKTFGDNTCTYGATFKDLAYNCDTEAGSLGSPVISKDNGKVVGMHHCGGDCGGNFALPVKHFAKIINSQIEASEEIAQEFTETPTPGPTMKDTPAPTFEPTKYDSSIPSDMPSLIPSAAPSIVDADSSIPSDYPSLVPTGKASSIPSDLPSLVPSNFATIGVADAKTSSSGNTIEKTTSENDKSDYTDDTSAVPSDMPSLVPSSVPQPTEEVQRRKHVHSGHGRGKGVGREKETDQDTGQGQRRSEDEAESKIESKVTTGKAAFVNPRSENVRFREGSRTSTNREGIPPKSSATQSKGIFCLFLSGLTLLITLSRT